MESTLSQPFELSPIDNISPRRHVNYMLFFPDSPIDPLTIFSSLTVGLTRTFQLLPLLSGTVKNTSAASQQGRLIVAEPWHMAEELLTLNDRRDDEDLDYVALRARHFPTSIWSQSIKDKIIDTSRLIEQEPPVLRANLILIRGGLILALSVHHCFTDGNGTATVIRVWRSCCQGDPPSLKYDSDLLSRARLMGKPDLASIDDLPGVHYYSETPSGSEAERSITRNTGSMLHPIYSWLGDLSAFVRQSILRSGLITTRQETLKDNTSHPKAVAPILFFSLDRLRELKALASTGADRKSTSAWISTNDAMTSLLWCSLIEARTSQNKRIAEMAKDGADHALAAKSNCGVSGEKKDEPASLRVVINCRRLFEPPLSPDFIGNAWLLSRLRVPLDQVHAAPASVCAMAFKIRESINEETSYSLERLLSALRSVKDIKKVRTTERRTDGLGLVISSWRNQDFYNDEWDKVFGVGCDRVRSFGILQTGLAVVMPEIAGSALYSSGPGLEVSLGILDDILPYLKENELLNQFAEWRC